MKNCLMIMGEPQTTTIKLFNVLKVIKFFLYSVVYIQKNPKQFGI
eukprot:UN26517